VTTPVATKICSNCGIEKRATLKYFHALAKSVDGLQTICKACRKLKAQAKTQEVVATMRREGLTPEEQHEMDKLDWDVIAHNKILDNPKSAASSRRNSRSELNSAIPKARKRLEKQIADRQQAQRAAELAKRQQGELLITQGLFPAPSVLPIGQERDALIRRLQEQVKILEGENFNTARAYLTEQIARLKNAIDAERQAETERIESAKAAQDVLDKAAADKAARKVYDWAKRFLLAPTMELTKRKQMQDYCVEMAAKYQSATKDPGVDETGARNSATAAGTARAYAKIGRMLEIIDQNNIKNFPEEYYTQNFACSPVNFNFRTSNEKALLRHCTLSVIGEKWAHTLPDAPPVIWNPEAPKEKLEHILSRIDEARAMEPQLEEEETKRQAYWENLKNTDPKRFEKESRDAILQVKGGGQLAQQQRESLAAFKKRDPQAYEDYCIGLLEPRNYELPTIVWLVPVYTYANPKLPHKMYWGDGREVQQGEIVFDYRLKKWFLPAEPAGTEIDFKKQTGLPTEAEIAKMSPEAQEFYRDTDSPLATRSLFAKPTPIKFEKGDRHVEGSGRDNFRYGSWWADEDIRRAHTGWNDQPPTILPPLKIAVADSIAVKPESEAELAKWKEPTETCWQKYTRLQKEQEQFQQELLN
jgi:hypothetical protein